MPEYRTNLVLVSSIVDNGHKLVHDKRKSLLCLKSKDKTPIERKGKLFFLRASPQHGYYVANLSGGPSQSEPWLKRFSRLNYWDLRSSLPIELEDKSAKCETYCLAEIVKTPVPKQIENKISKPPERVFTDVVGPVTPFNVDGFRYFVTFVDEYSSHACVKFMRTKNEGYQKFKEYLANYGTHCILRPDNCTEYANGKFKKFCTNNKIRKEYTVPETLEQNGVAERYNRTVVETAQGLLIEPKWPKSFWLRAVDAAAFVHNLLKKDKIQKNPYEKLWANNL